MSFLYHTPIIKFAQMTSINLYKPALISSNGPGGFTSPLRGRGHNRGAVDVTINIPSSWNELSKEELLFICKKLIEMEETGYSGKVEIFLFIISHNAGLQKVKLVKNWQQNLSGEDVAVNGLDTINWILETADLTKQLIPSIPLSSPLQNWRGVRGEGPQSSFDDITCGEFEDTEVFFNKYNQTKDNKDMAMLTAILWRVSSGAKRAPYFGYNTEKYVPAVSALPAEILLANYIWYIGCRQLLPKLFPGVFSSSSSGADMAAFTKCIHAGAGPKNGTRDQIRKTLLKEFFLDMELEAQKIKDESK